MSQSPRANLIGGLWMIAAMFSFAIEDSLIKASVTSLPLSQVIVMFGIAGLLVFAALARLQGQKILTAEPLHQSLALRAVFEVIGRLFFFLAIALAPLSSATVILQATPIVVVAGAALFLNETVGWRRWSAIAVGLLGVLIILQPGSASFTVYSWFAVIGMLGLAGRDLASRVAPATIGTHVLGVYGFLSVIAAGVLYSVWTGDAYLLPNGTVALKIAAAAGFGVIAYASLMKAMRTGEISAVAPLRYSRLLIGVAIGILVFGETLSLQMILGSALIVLSGLFLLWRGRCQTINAQ